ncbi:MAG TPA: protein kinase [Methanospirillum sp.]|uniref:protein kinase domain-containing protein n=1 Tax=Methanospirillum sp. TaxID=45200 RepID=UPI002B781B81|nr:protein kinase [Methanospirillum sp.]HWQ65168.1 protein kinase [Methanospirillum sp.]
MTPPLDDPPTIREGVNPDIRKGKAVSRDIAEYAEPEPISGEFRGYRLIRQFPAAGGEADIWLIHKDTGYGVLKHYRLGIEPKRDVLDKVAAISHKNPRHLVRIHSFGFDEATNRWYEIQEYAGNGSLKDLIRNQNIGMSQFRSIIGEILEGLESLHQSGILHLDLKPSNILIRSLRPLNLILIDFGISTLLQDEFSRQVTSTKGTPMYWAPEQLGNIVGKEADYWALGVIALEIFTHRHPFDGMNHNVILATLSTRGIQIPPDIHPKTANLLKGLLTRNPRRRWGYREVSAWLAGRQNIPVFYEVEFSSGSRKSLYEFRGEQYNSLEDLSYALISDPESWDDAKRHIGRGYLNQWLEKTEQYDKAVEIEKLGEQYPDEDERLIFLVARYNPSIQFAFLGKPLDVSSIAGYLDRYMRHLNDEREKRIISMLFSGKLNQIYQTFLEISGVHDETSQISRMFAWLASNPRGTDEKKQLYDFLSVLKEREELGSLEEWDTKAVLRLAEIRNLFLNHGYDDDSIRVREELKTACKHALQSDSCEPDLLVALASAAEEVELFEFVSPCLKKAAATDIRVISLLFSKKKGMIRFKLYKRMRMEYEKNLYSLSSDPWRETPGFWQSQFFSLKGDKVLPLAISVAERLIETDNFRIQGFVMRGCALAQIGRVKEAEFFFSHPDLLSSQDPEVWQILGTCHARARRTEEARQAFLKGLSFEKDHQGLRNALIKLSGSQKNHTLVLESCEEALGRDPDNPELLLKKADTLFAIGNIGEATIAYEQYIRICPKNNGARISLARCQIKLKMNSEAEEVIKPLLESEIADPQAYRLKAYLLLITGKVRDAIKYLDLALESEPEDEWTIKIKADAHLAIKEFGPALRSISKILEKDPQNFLFLEKQGKIFLSLGFFTPALESLKSAVNGGRNTIELCIQYGDALRRAGDDRYGSPKDVHEITGHSLKWRVSSLYLDLWDMDRVVPGQIERYMEAAEWYERALTIGGEESVIMNRKGIIAALLGNYEEAITAFRTAADAKKMQPAYRTNLAALYVLKGEIERGSGIFLQGMSKFSKVAQFLDQCAGMYFQYIGDDETALDLCSQAVKANTARDPNILYHQYQALSRMNQTERAGNVRMMIHRINPWFRIPGSDS